MVKKWEDVFISKRNNLNTQLFSLSDHLSTYNAALGGMAGSMTVGEEFSQYEERYKIDVVKKYDHYATNFYNMLKACEFVEETPGASLTPSRDSSPAGASIGARGLGKFINMPQMDLGPRLSNN